MHWQYMLRVKAKKFQSVARLYELNENNFKTFYPEKIEKNNTAINKTSGERDGERQWVKIKACNKSTPGVQSESRLYELEGSRIK